jgi:hypothetical protein
MYHSSISQTEQYHKIKTINGKIKNLSFNHQEFDSRNFNKASKHSSQSKLKTFSTIPQSNISIDLSVNALTKRNHQLQLQPKNNKANDRPPSKRNLYTSHSSSRHVTEHQAREKEKNEAVNSQNIIQIKQVISMPIFHVSRASNYNGEIN